jgi:hypothetical protein
MKIYNEPIESHGQAVAEQLPKFQPLTSIVRIHALGLIYFFSVPLGLRRFERPSIAASAANEMAANATEVARLPLSAYQTSVSAAKELETDFVAAVNAGRAFARPMKAWEVGNEPMPAHHLPLLMAPDFSPPNAMENFRNDLLIPALRIPLTVGKLCDRHFVVAPADREEIFGVAVRNFWQRKTAHAQSGQKIRPKQRAAAMVEIFDGVKRQTPVASVRQNRIPAEIRMRPNGEPALRVNQSNRFLRFEIIRNLFFDADRQNVSALALDLLADDNEKIIDALAQVSGKRDVVEIGHRNAVDAAGFDRAPYILEAIMAANVNVQIELHAEI